MKQISQAFSIAGYNFRLWRRNPRILVTFLLAFIMCFLLSDKIVRFAADHNVSLQLVEAFIWSFGDSNSILVSNMLLIMLFADMPFLSSGTPFYLVRTDRKTWITGQVIYTIAAVSLYLLFVLAATILLSIRYSYPANMWSPTAAILGYTNAGQRVAIPALLKQLEMSWPYQSMISIFFLMLGYTIVLVMIMLVCNLRFGQAAGVVSVFVFSIYGLLMQPDTIGLILKLPDEAYYIANVIIGWISPLNHATYHMHNFGYDKLPWLWQSYLIFFVLLIALYIAAIRAAKQYNFSFIGTEGLTMEASIEVKQVCKSFGEEQILKNVSHCFEKGKTHGIVGNNGSGKTVLMKCICGFIRPDSGEITVNHMTVGRNTDFPEDIGIIIETPGFLPHLSGVQNLKILATLKKKANDYTIRAVLKQVGLDPEMKKPVSKYSLGMRQRLGLAQALMEDPSLLILDEPFNGLDKHGVRHIRNLIKGLHDEGKTVILASHNQVDIDELCDTVCEMDAGVLTVVRK